MEYKDIKTPEQLLKYMEENIKYGFVDNTGKCYEPENREEFQNDWATKWQLSSPERLIKVKYAICWDQLELERDWFKTHNYNFKTFYIWFELPYNNSYSTHTYLVFENNGKYYYFEYSDFDNRGIYEFSSYEEAIFYQKEKLIQYNKKNNSIKEEELKHLHIYEYDRPIYGCTANEFIDCILEKGKKIE